MLIDIKSSGELGILIRATRKHQKIRMDDVAGSAGVGPVFVREVERGKPSVQLGRVMKLLDELGIELKADIADAVVPHFLKMKEKGLKPITPRGATKGSGSAASTSVRSTAGKAIE